MKLITVIKTSMVAVLIVLVFYGLFIYGYPDFFYKLFYKIQKDIGRWTIEISNFFGVNPLIVTSLILFSVVTIILDRMKRLLTPISRYIFKYSRYILKSDSRIYALKRMKEEELRDVAISLVYLKHFKNKNKFIKFLLLRFSGTAGIISYIYGDTDFIFLAIIAIVLFCLIESREIVIGHRIRNGWFGTTNAEARDMIIFLIENADNIDFTDSNGKIRRALLPESSEASDSACAAVGGKVPA